MLETQESSITNMRTWTYRAVGGVLGDNDGGPDSVPSLGESQQAGEGDKLRQSHYGDGLLSTDAVMSERG